MRFDGNGLQSPLPTDANRIRGMTLFNYFKGQLKKVSFLRKIVSYFRNRNKNGYRELRIRLEKADALSAKTNPDLRPLHMRLKALSTRQKSEWESFVYCDGYFYQGFERIGISGIKPTEKRIDKYEIKRLFDKNKDVLDIGANCGFLACYLSDHFRMVDGIELNPYLVQMAEETKKHLAIENVHFIKDDFATHEFEPQSYDVVFSLSNHYTIDGNLNKDFNFFITKIFEILKKDGILFFESHNVDGDDRDLEEKFRTASQYFDLVDNKMVRAFHEPDIDKLFAIFKKREAIGEPQSTGFNLEEAKNRYHYNAS